MCIYIRYNGYTYIRIYAAAFQTLFRQRVNDFPSATKMQFRFSDGKSQNTDEIAREYESNIRLLPSVYHCSVNIDNREGLLP